MLIPNQDNSLLFPRVILINIPLDLFNIFAAWATLLPLFAFTITDFIVDRQLYLIQRPAQLPESRKYGK